MFSTEVFDNSSFHWTQIKDSIFSIEEEAFDEHSFTRKELEEDFLNSENIIVLLKNIDNEEVIGFTYAKPSEPETSDGPAKPGETAWIWDTVIRKEYRGKKLLGIMMEKLEEELRRRGFKYIERNAMVTNNFANNISKYYKERIIKTFPLESKWGPQVFFRIKL